MPGIFGSIGCEPRYYKQLRRSFAEAWGACEVLQGDGWLLGGHAFGGNRSVYATSPAMTWAADGEYSLYLSTPSGAAELFDISSGRLDLAPACRGNVAVIDSESHTLHLAVEWSGTFPLYYAYLEGGVLFSSLLHPLSKIMRARMDELGVLQFLRQAFIYAGRTQFQGITRLLPGQSLCFESRSGEDPQISEASHLWKGLNGRPGDRTRAARTCWDLIQDGLETGVPPGTDTALMMSAGWDSRTLLASVKAIEGSRKVSCYSHGDLESRELRITSRLCQAARIKCRQEPIDEDVLDLGFLQAGFQRTGNVVFPHWHRAGALLAGFGVKCVLSGVYGEVLGGHYGRAMILSGRRKVAAVASALMNVGGLASRGTRAVPDVRSLLHLKTLGEHWYLRDDFERSLKDPLAEINADIDRTLARLRQRGVVTADQLIEAFISENRGTQYINAQILSCRAYTDIAIPYTYRPLALFSSRIPFPAKVHNRLNQQILADQAPSLLRYPMAATLVPAAYPIMLQEATRLFRRTRENRNRARFYALRGECPAPRSGWPYFEFLRSGKLLHNMIDDLRTDIWDRKAMHRCIAEIPKYRWHIPLHSIYDQMAKIYTIDLLLR